MTETIEIKKYDYEMLDFSDGNIFRAVNDDDSFENAKAEAAELVAEEQEQEEAPQPQVEEAPQEEAEVEEEVVLPSFSEEEVEIAKKLAKEEGVREGLAQAQEQQDKAAELAQQKANELLEKINSELPNISKSLQDDCAEIQKHSVDLAYKVAKKILGKKQAEAVAEEIESSINNALTQIAGKDDLKLIVNPELLEQLSGKFGAVELASDAEILPTDFKIEWQNGFVQKQTGAIWNEIEQILATGKIEEKEIVAEAAQSEETQQEVDATAGEDGAEVAKQENINETNEDKEKNDG